MQKAAHPPRATVSGHIGWRGCWLRRRLARGRARGGMPRARTLRFLRRRWQLPRIDRCEIDDAGIIAQLHEELPILRMRHRQCISRETVRNLHGMPEVRIGGDRVDQVETASRQLACEL